MMDDGDIIFSGLYDLSYTSYTAPGALICRLSPDGSSVRWTTRVHSPLHGGETVVRALAVQGEDIFMVGHSSEFGAADPLLNPNALAMKMDGDGNLVWISSLGRKRRSQAKSEYTDDLGLAVVPAPDGGMFMAGTTNSFSHPKPFHRIRQWATEHCDLLLARFGPDGGLANVPQGRYPAIFNQTDPGDKKKVDVVHPPIEIQDLPVSVSPVDVRALTVDFQSASAQWETRFSDDPQSGNRPPSAAFKVGPPPGGAALSAALDAGASSDPDGDDIAGYLWEFPNNRTATGQKTAFRAKVASNHIISLTVQDQYGYQSDPVSKEIWLFPKVRNEVLPPGLVCGHKAGYEIEVATGDIKDAGTNARAYLSLFGPADEDGQRCTSGHFNLSVDNTPANKPGTDLFEQGQIDHFIFPDYGQRGELDEVDHAVLCHDNTGHKPGWFVEGFKVRDTTNDQTWYFVPLTWLSEDSSTQAQFRSCEPYPCGVLLGRNPGLAWQLTAASDHVVILPQDAESVFLTACERDQEMEVYRQGALEGRQEKNGSGPRRVPYIHPDERGVEIEAGQLTEPTRYDFKLRSSGEWQYGTIWLFPHQWADYQTTARQAAILLSLEGRTDNLFGVWNAAKARLEGQPDNLSTALQGIIDYGRDAIGIFGDIPDNTLRGMTQGAVEQYIQNKLLVALAAKSVELSAGALSDMRTIFGALTRAKDWGLRLEGLLTDLQGQVFQTVVLHEIPAHNSAFKTLGPLLDVIKAETESFISMARANDPYQCQEIMDRIKTLVAGDILGQNTAQIQASADDPDAYKIDYQGLGVVADTAERYPLVYLLLSHYRTARDLWGNPRQPDDYFWHGTPEQEAGCNALAQYGICDHEAKKAANVAAMETYVPLLEGFGSLTSILLNACLVP